MKIIKKISALCLRHPKKTAFFVGFLAAFAFPPFNALPLLWCSFPILFLLLRDAKNKKEAFLRGWLFAFGHLIVCLHWIAASLFVEIAAFWWALPLAVCGLPAVLAVFYGLATMGAYRWGLSRFGGVFFFALCWFLADLARAHLFTGLPWDILGYVWSDVSPVLQSVSVWGIEGLTGVTIFLALLPAFFFYPRHRRQARVILGFGLLLLVVIFSWGALRLSSAVPTMVPDVVLRLVQPDQDQALKWRPDQRRKNLDKIINISFTAKNDAVTHYIWPETATSYYLSEMAGARNYIANHIPKGRVLITGAVRRGKADGDTIKQYYNSLLALNDRGDVIAAYDKHHLVPFGEYIPLRSVLPFRVVTALGVNFRAGQGIQSVRVPNLPVLGPLVCYEAIFSNEVASREDPPQLLVNLTNDAWYEGTIGIAQHFAMVKVRAIEEGMPLVRVANKGVTGIVDPWGRFAGLSSAKKVGFVDLHLPESLDEMTKFSELGRIFLWLMLVILFSCSYFPRVTSSKS